MASYDVTAAGPNGSLPPTGSGVIPALGTQGWVELTCAVSGSYTLPGVSGIGFALSQGALPGTNGADITLNLVAGTPVRVWMQVMSGAGSTAPALYVPPASITISVVQGSVSLDEDATGAASGVGVAAGSLDIPEDVTGAATVVSAPGAAQGTADIGEDIAGAASVVGVAQGAADISEDATGSGTVANPSWVLDYASVGEDTSKFKTISTGSASAVFGSNKYILQSVADNGAVAGMFTQPIDWTKQERFTIDVKRTSSSTGATPTFIGIYEGATQPPLTTNDIVNQKAIARATVAPAGPYFQLDYNPLRSAVYSGAYFWRNNNSTWDTNDGGYGQLAYVLANKYRVIVEHDAAGMAIEIRDASGTLLKRTTKIPKASLGTKSDNWWVAVGEFYTDAWQTALEITRVAYDAGIGTIS